MPNGPPGHLLAGKLLELRRDWLGTLTRYAREYGDFVPMRLGPKRAVLLSSAGGAVRIAVTCSPCCSGHATRTAAG